MKDQTYTHSSELFALKNFSYEKRPVQGVNGQAFVSMNKYIPTEKLKSLEPSINLGLAKSKNLKHGFILGETIPEEKDIFPGPLEAEVLTQLEKFDPTGEHTKIMQNLDMQERRRYIYFTFGGISPWYATLYLRHAAFHQKTQEGQQQDAWESDAQYFPELVEYLKSLKGTLFSQIGRVMFFISYPNVPTITHRDDIDIRHKDQSVNLYFKGHRKTFVYDTINNQKTYLSSDCTAFYFNNRDYHGVEAEPFFNYTLRVDGQFKPEVQDELGLEEGFIRGDKN